MENQPTIETVRDLVERTGREMYAQGLNDLVSEIKLKKADGFVIDELIVLELVEMLVGKNNRVG